MRAKGSTHLNVWLFSAPRACLHRLSELGTSERQAPPTGVQAMLLDHHRPGSLPPKFGTMVCPDHWPPPSTILQAPGMRGYPLLGAACGLEGLTNKLASCCRCLKLLRGQRETSECPHPSRLFLGGPWTARAWAFKTVGCLPQNLFANKHSYSHP